MTIKSILVSILGKINSENLDKALKMFDEGMKTFGKNMKDLGDSMQTFQDDFKDDIEKSNRFHEERESINKKNLEKIWGKKK